MTKTLTILALFFSILVHGQVRTAAAYKNIPGLVVPDSIVWKDVVGGFYLSNGFGGYNFRLDSNMTFRKIDFSCLARFTVDSGSWTIKNSNTVVLKSKAKTLYFDIVKFDSYYFFILPAQRQKFVADLQSTRLKLKNAKPFTIDNKIYSVNYLIGYGLIEKYFGKEIEDITGT